MLARRLRTGLLAGVVGAVRVRPPTVVERRVSGSNAATRRAVMARRAVLAHVMRRMKSGAP